MIFILDSRNQEDSFVYDALTKLGHTCYRDYKLAFGDIAVNGDLLNAIDLKSSGGGLIELSRNICSKDHARLKAEIQKAVDKGGHLTFLCFEKGIKSVDDIEKWTPPTFKSTQYKTVFYDRETDKKVTKTHIKMMFNRAWRTNQFEVHGNFAEALKNYVNANYYAKKELAHTKGNKMTQVNPKTLAKAIRTMSEPDHYGKGVKIDFEFTTKEECGEKIIEIFNRKRG